MRDTIDMAREAGFTWEPIGNIIGPLERFEALARADEREACAELCSSLEEQCEKLGLPDEKWPTPADCAFAIRNRGNT